MQERIVLSRCGNINPESIDEALAWDAYKGLEKALKTMTPEEVYRRNSEIRTQGQRRRRLPYRSQWKFAHAPQSEVKYIHLQRR
jgi:NADH:ubiquinone oxidoreductase subunit F (NADH-binding)